MSILGAAIALAKKGYAVHWLRARSKAPIAERWSTAPVASLTEIRQAYKPGYNVGVRCGHWSEPESAHGLVILDVDIRTPEVTQDALSAVEALCGSDGPIVFSGSGNGSRHRWFTCPIDRLPPKANVTILAADGWKLEVLSTGKQVVVPPSIHPSGHPYRWQIPLVGDLPLLPASMHSAIEEALATSVRKSITQGHVVHGAYPTNGHRPGDDFNRRADWFNILEPHGWMPIRQRGDITDWRRPGKNYGISGTTNYGGSALLYVFSSNAAPFEPDTAYSPFAAYALLNHSGEFTRAARALQVQGYGRVWGDPWLGPRDTWHGVPLGIVWESSNDD